MVVVQALPQRLWGRQAVEARLESPQVWLVWQGQGQGQGEWLAWQRQVQAAAWQAFEASLPELGLGPV